MSTRNAIRVIDGDGHIQEDMAGIIARMDRPYRTIVERQGQVFPPLDHLHTARAVETPPQRDGRPTVGPEGWLAFLEDVGIEQTVLYPTRALSYGKIVSLDYAVAACRAYNDWLHETYVKFNPRFKGMAIIPMQDPEEAARELGRIDLAGGVHPPLAAWERRHVEGRDLEAAAGLGRQSGRGDAAVGVDPPRQPRPVRGGRLHLPPSRRGNSLGGKDRGRRRDGGETGQQTVHRRLRGWFLGRRKGRRGAVLT
jgi:hypothetical protein